MGDNKDVDLNQLTVDDKLNLLINKMNSLTSTIEHMNTRVSALETTNKTNTVSIQKNTTQSNTNALNIADIQQQLNEYDDYAASVKYTSETIDTVQQSVSTMETSIAQLSKENVALKHRIDNLSKAVATEQANNNQQHQYFRTSVNVKLCNVPLCPGEEQQSPDVPSNQTTLHVIHAVCEAADISYNPHSIDVCHRIGSDSPRAPIIIRFRTKSDRFEFWSQRNKLKNISASALNYSNIPKPVPPSTPRQSNRSQRQQHEHQHRPTNNNNNNHDSIYMQEHLTKLNKTLLKEAKTVFKDLAEYPGYVKNGEIRVKRSATDAYHIISSRLDILNVKKKLDPPNGNDE